MSKFEIGDYVMCENLIGVVIDNDDKWCGDCNIATLTIEITEDNDDYEIGEIVEVSPHTSVLLV